VLVIQVSFAQVTLIAVSTFGVGVLLGMLMYRVMWHVDTATLRREIDTLRTEKAGLFVEVLRVSDALDRMNAKLLNLNRGVGLCKLIYMRLCVDKMGER
jgi:hypothetical protein